MDMRRIAFWSPKGGVGKTTLALNFAAAAYYAGYKVLVCDLDPQQSAVDVFSESQLPFSVVPDLPQVPPNVDFIISDYAPTLENLPVEETIIVPMRASILDLKAVTKAQRFIRDKRIIKCVNAVDTRRHEERIMAMKLYADGCHLIKDRSIYVRSLATGKTVFQQSSYGAREARNEFNRLLERVINP
jgi:chromosome partitioning protein